MRNVYHQSCFAGAMLLATFARTFTLASDRSGVSPQSISLPSGPGSIEGLGESFEPQLNSGTFSYRIPLKLPPIRGGAPVLAVAYSSGNGNGMLGLGWTLRLPAIRRQTDKGLPQFVDTDLFYDENAEELVNLADGSYRQKIESTFIRYERTSAGGWLGRLPNGTVLAFGTTGQSRLNWTGHGTFAWMVDSSQDPNGNRVEYYYHQDGQQIYPKEIRYGLHATQPSGFFSVQFGYSTNRPDPFVDCRARFASTNRLRLETVTVSYGSRRIRQYRFGYDPQAPVSLLTSVIQFGDERSATNNAAQPNVDFLPPTYFDYTPYSIPAGPDVQTIYFNAREPNFSFGGEDGNADGNNAEFVDIDHDGLPDILVNSDSEWRSLLNPGPFTKTWPLFQVITNPPPVTGARLGQPTTRLVDLRGDGRAKLMLSQSDASPDQATAFYYYDFLSPTALGPAQPYFTFNGINIAENEVQFVDLDDDKAMDLIRINGTDSSGFLEGLYTRNFEGQTNQYLATPNTWGFDFTHGWQMADMNGDRLQDFVWLNGRDNTAVSLNLGWGQFAPPYLMAGGPDWATLETSGTSGPRLIDLNQNGLADLIIVENQDIRIWFNQNGTSWSEPVVLTGTPVFQSGQTAVRFADINGNGSVDIIWHQGQEPFIQVVDLFPAGKAYLLSHASTTLGRSLDITYRSSTDFMSLAVGTTNQWTVVAPFLVPVISQIVEGDGLGNHYTNQFTYRNAYYDGLEREFRGFEQAVRRELGNEAQGAPTLVTRFGFDTGATVEALKGKPLQVEAATDSGGVFYRQTNDWTPRVLALQQATGETRQVTFAFQNRKLTQEVELGTDADAVTIEEEFEYDDYGNEIRHADYGRVENRDRSAWADERVFVRQFSAEFPAGTNLWILDRLVTEQRQDLRGAVIAQKQIFYDDQTFAGEILGTMTRGNPTLIREWIDTTKDVFRATLRQEYDSFGNVVGAYDPLGTPGRSDLGHYRQIEFDSQIHTLPIRETIYTANPDALASGSMAPPLVAVADYDFGLGVIRSATDFNQNTTLFDFDTFGRLSRITKPYDNTNFPTAVFSYMIQQPVGNGQAVNYTQSRLREVADQPGTFDSRTYFDGLGRKVMTRTESETNAVVVVTDVTQFNQRRKAWKSFLPYFEWASLEFQPLVETNAFHETHYDALGREIVTYQPLTAADGHRDFSRTVYGPLTRLVYDEEQTRPDSPHYGAGMRYTEDGLRDKDGKGRLRWVEEIVKLTDDGLPAGNTNNWQTQYRYDLLDNFLGYTDSQGNQKEFRYDALSRKTFMDDPDRGTMTYTYDDASNLRETVDAKGQHIQYTYDGVNRLLTEDYKAEGPPLSANFAFDPALPLSSTNRSDVAYFYDAPVTSLDLGNGTVATAQNTKGFLAYVWDLTGEEHTSYDARGRVTYTVKRIKDPLHGRLVNFRTGFAYDSLDRVTQLTYPDDDFVFYQYNARNLLARISGGQVIGALGTSNVIAGISYRASGQLAQVDYGNGVRTTYAYDPRLRLISLLTVSQPSTLNSQLINFAYDFDGASNIKSITDGRPTSVVPATDKCRNTQAFTYDDIYRLTAAQYNAPAAASANGGQIFYRYDRIGNMLAQTSDITHLENGLSVTDLGAMSYGGTSGKSNRIGRQPSDPPGPHALTSILNLKSQITNRHYPYDANGNMSVIDGLTNTWDFKDRLIRVESPNMVADYTYDYTDRRVTKHVVPRSYPLPSDGVVSEGITLYIDKYSEVRPGEVATKYIWNGETRVACLTAQLSPGPRIQRLRYKRGWNLLASAVHEARLPASPDFIFAVQWKPDSSDWLTTTPSDSLSPQTVLWLRSGSDGTLTLSGTPALTGSRVMNGPGFFSGWGTEAMPLTTNLPAGLDVWAWDGVAQTWRTRFSDPLAATSDLPATLDAGRALFARCGSALTLPGPDPARAIRFYHQDHLGSSSYVSDSVGHLVEEIAYYPFGNLRHQLHPAGLRENYKFAQKETDAESGYDYFEARFYCSKFGNFTRVDPLVGNLKRSSLTSPQTHNPFVFCLNNPLTLADPSGMEAVVTTDAVENPQITYSEGTQTIDFTKSADETGSKVGNMAGNYAKDIAIEGSKAKLEFAEQLTEKEFGEGASRAVGAVRKTLGRVFDAAEIYSAYKSEGKNGVCQKITEIAVGEVAGWSATGISGGWGILAKSAISIAANTAVQQTGLSKVFCDAILAPPSALKVPQPGLLPPRAPTPMPGPTPRP